MKYIKIKSSFNDAENVEEIPKEAQTSEFDPEEASILVESFVEQNRFATERTLTYEGALAGIDNWMEKRGLKSKYRPDVALTYRNYILNSAFKNTYTLR